MTNPTNDPTTGGSAVPAVPAGTVRGATLTRKVRLAKPALVAACARIDALPEFAGRNADQETLILRKVDAYRDWVKEYGLMPCMHGGHPSPGRVLAHIGHARAEVTRPIAAAIAALVDLLPGDELALRAVGDQTVDLLIDAHAIEMEERGYGLTRNGNTRRICWRTTAKDVGCEPGQLTPLHRVRLRALDRQIGVPGPTADTAVGGFRSTARNAVAVPLLAAELERRKGRMPADPLNPGMIDAIEIAEGAGVSPQDILTGSFAEQNLRDMEAARDRRPLVPHPLVAARRFTYADLKEYGREASVARAEKDGLSDPNAAGRVEVRALTRFLTLAGVGGQASDLVHVDFPDRVERALALRPPFGSGWAARMREWIRHYHSFRSDRPLPDAFATAIRILAAEVGTTVSKIERHIGRRAHNWLHGEAFPSHESEREVEKLEAFLLVRKGTLSKLLAKEWRTCRLEVSLKELGMGGVSRKLPSGVSELEGEEQVAAIKAAWHLYKRQDTEFSRRLSKQVRDHYRLPFASWPQIMCDAWLEQMPDVDKGDGGRRGVGLRIPGSRPTKQERANAKKEEERSWRPPTMRMGEHLIGFLFGYLVRPRAEEGAEPETVGSETVAEEALNASETPFVSEPGLGMPVELVHPALFAIVDLLLGYAHWRQSRSGGKFAPTTTHTLKHVVEFLKPGTGLVWKNPGWIVHLERFKEWWEANDVQLPAGRLFLDLEAFHENWELAVEEAYDFLRADIGEMQDNSPTRPKVRNPFIPIAGYLAEDDPTEVSDPMVKYMIGVREMLGSKPMSMIDRHLHRRNGILTLILLQTGLRANTLLLTVSGANPTLRREERNGVVKWRIVIPASRFKNWRSPFFSGDRPYEFVLDDEDKLYAMLDEYLAKGRPYLLNGRNSDSLFVTRKGKDFDSAQLSTTYRNLTGMFFVRDEEAKTGIEGVRPHGVHAVRHIIATSLLRTTGDIYLAAHAIQDTARTVERHYVDFLPRDKVRLVVEHLRLSRAPVIPQSPGNTSRTAVDRAGA